MHVKEYKCHKIASGRTEGELLISADDICFYLCEPSTGKLTEEGHSIFGRDISGKILVFPGGKGSSCVQLDGLYQLMQKGKSPKGMIVEYADTILVTSAILMNMPLVDKMPADFYKNISDGTICTLDADRGIVTICS